MHLALTNSPAFVAVWLATMRLGAWIVPRDPMATRARARRPLERTRAGGRRLLRRERAEVVPRRGRAAGREVVEVDEADTELGDRSAPPVARTMAAAARRATGRR